MNRKAVQTWVEIRTECVVVSGEKKKTRGYGRLERLA